MDSQCESSADRVLQQRPPDLIDPARVRQCARLAQVDTLTERDVMKAVGALHGTKTIIMIAHRLSTVRICDRIVVLEKGRQIGLGSYAELSEDNAGFQRMLAG